MTTELEQLLRQAEATAQLNRLQDHWADTVSYSLTGSSALAEAMLDQQRVEHDAWLAAYMMEEACKPTTRSTLERVMADAKRAIQEASGLTIRDGTGALVFGVDVAGNMTATSVSTDQLYWQDAEQAWAFDRAMPSDRDGIAEDMRRELGRMPVPIAKPAPVDAAKPAVAGLGVMASGDHRPGLWRTFD